MNWKILLSLMVSFALLMSSSYTMLIPFLPVYMKDELGATDETVGIWSGITYAITFAISAIVSPLWGKLSDKMGKKPMMIRSSVLIAITYFLGGIVSTPFELFLVRAFQGFAAGLWPACLVMVSAYVPKNKLGLSMGLMQSANICGGIIGPLLGGVLATVFGMRNSFFAGSAVLSLITLITVIFIKEPPAAADADNDTNGSKMSYFELIKDRNVLLLLFCVCITNLVIMQIQPIVALYVESLSDNNDNSVLLTGIILSLGGIAGALASPIWGRTGQNKGFFKTITLAFISAGLLMCLQSLPDDLVIFGLMQFLCGLGFSGIFPSANSIMVLFTPPKARGIGFGSLFSAQMIGGALGPVIGGLLASFISYKSVYVLSGSLLFSTGVYLLFLAPASFKEKAGITRENYSKRNGKDYLKRIKDDLEKEMSENCKKE
ncbi:MAG: MFS transporter [Succinivibrio sp.]